MSKAVFTLFAFSLAILAGLNASAYYSCCSQPCCDPCPSWCCGSFEVGGQWIYLRPTSCDDDFAIKDPRLFDPVDIAPTNPNATIAVTRRLPQGQSRGLDPNYESGFRVSLGYLMDCPCYDIRLEYTYHHPTESSKVSGGETSCGLWPTYMHPRYARNLEVMVNNPVPVIFTGFETPIYNGLVNNQAIQALVCSSVKFDYDAVDLQVGSRSMKSCHLWMRTYAGLHFMNLDHKQTAQYTGAFFGVCSLVDPEVVDDAIFDTLVRCTKNTWGVGPLFGIDARYDIACGLGIAGHIGAAILAGETHGKMFERDTRTFQNFSPNLSEADFTETLDVCHASRHLVFPYLRGSLGINYLWCCNSCFKVLFEVGYEFNSYINSIGQFRFNDGRGTGMGNCYSYNLDGIYVSIRATL